MARIDKEVNKYLKDMRKIGGTEKGIIGEEAAFRICENFYQAWGGILIHSYSYKTDSTQAGNIKKNDTGLYIENLGSSTEIDILYISKYRVYPIEVKAYKANKITLKDDRIEGCRQTDKSPVHQNEMHCRHLYQHIFRAIPNGETKYIVPIVYFVDEAEIIDMRTDWQKDYVKVCTLNSLEKIIMNNSLPFEYQLNLTLMDKLLKEVQFSSEKYLPVRY